MSAFSAVNSSLPASDNSQTGESQPPSTQHHPEKTAEQPSGALHRDESSPSTPTRHSFGGVLGQRPLPNELPSASSIGSLLEPVTPLKKDGSFCAQGETQDVEMGEADDDEHEDDGSDNESIISDSQRPSKKKKGQRFYCTDYPPCQLSFTRSEHLARHIRKHTGERPFQCHCSRRFSRLDNLRQHAQTVHVNEDIPGDSLAATSTRFQRQIRTDRVRPPNNRSRASTIGSQSGNSRGHSRNLSTSSIGSTASSMGAPEDIRRRPQPLAMAHDINGRGLSSLDTYGGPVYYGQSPSGFNTPTSTTFSAGGQSPRLQSMMVSPSSSLGRSSYYNGARAQNRRLSVPSVNNPFQNPGGGYGTTIFGTLQTAQSPNFSRNSSVYGSPTSSVFSHGRRDSDAEMDPRRRTWHPSTNSQYAQRPATSGLTYHQTPDEPRPAFIQQHAASQMTRLPGIESFDHAPPPNLRQHPSPMTVDSSPRPTSSGRPFDSVLHQGLTRLDITAANAPVEGQWHGNQPPPYHYTAQGPSTAQYIQQKHSSMPEPPVTPLRSKRNAWYGGPPTPVHGGTPTTYLPQRPSPEDSGSSDGVHTPSTSQAPEYNPVIVNPAAPAETFQPGQVGIEEKTARADSGYQTFPQPPAQPPQTYALQVGNEPRSEQPAHGQPNNGLELLVAAATQEQHRS